MAITDDIYYTQNAQNTYGSGDFSGGSTSSGSGFSSNDTYSGMPAWFNYGSGSTSPYSINNLWGAAFKGAGDAWKNAQSGGQVNPATQALIEKQRTLMPEQYRNQMDAYYQRSINPMMNRLSSRGILNSSVTGDALAKAHREQAATNGDKVVLFVKGAIIPIPPVLCWSK